MKLLRSSEDAVDELVGKMDVFTWLELGLREGWCSKVVCATHDGLPSTDEEDDQWEAGEDPCVAAVRLNVD
jgi:hypothetical protein